MSSPFPGMDPYIESTGVWGDFHGSFLAAARAALNTVLPDGYTATLEVYVTSPPQTTTFPSLPRRKRRVLHVLDNATRRVVTAVELLSPANKRSGADRNAYLAKREEYAANQVSLVELDLLRGGRRLPLGRSDPEIRDYYALVLCCWDYPRAGIWSFSLRDPLPEIPVPVAPDLAKVGLPLRACVDRVYDEGRYGRLLAYDDLPQPRLRREDVGWARDVLAGQSS